MSNNNNNNEDAIDNYVILDCDTGTDDAWALILLLKADQIKNIKLLGITCVNGNTKIDNVLRNTITILNGFNRTDIPVYKGCESSILEHPSDYFSDYHFFHGLDGMGDLDDVHSKDPIDTSIVQSEHAVNALYNLVCKYPKKITIISVGPLTNLAMTINMYGTDFTDKLKSVFIMGGNISGVGNTPKSAEFNFYWDPEAASIVLNKLICPITIIPWETCLDGKISIPMDWRLNVLGKYKNKSIELLNKAEEKIYKVGDFNTWVPCDAFIVAAFLFPKKVILKKSYWHGTIELYGNHTRGQMVLDHSKRKKNNINVIEEINDEIFMKITLWAVDNTKYDIE